VILILIILLLEPRTIAVRKGQRDRPGRSVRRLAEQMGRQIPLTDLPARRRDADGSGRDDRAPHLQLHRSGLVVMSSPGVPRGVRAGGETPPQLAAGTAALRASWKASLRSCACIGTMNPPLTPPRRGTDSSRTYACSCSPRGRGRGWVGP